MRAASPQVAGHASLLVLHAPAKSLFSAGLHSACDGQPAPGDAVWLTHQQGTCNGAQGDKAPAASVVAPVPSSPADAAREASQADACQALQLRGFLVGFLVGFLIGVCDPGHT